jgi:hypothetical protein
MSLPKKCHKRGNAMEQFIQRHKGKITGTPAYFNRRRPCIHLNGQIREKEKAREVAQSDGTIQAFICNFTAVAACQSFNPISGDKMPYLINAARR